MKYTKDLARYYVMYQDNLTESQKIELLKFISEADTENIKTLLYTGYMTEGMMPWNWGKPDYTKGSGSDNLSQIQKKIEHNKAEYAKSVAKIKKSTAAQISTTQKKFAGVDAKMKIAKIKSQSAAQLTKVKNGLEYSNKALQTKKSVLIQKAQKAGYSMNDIVASLKHGKGVEVTKKVTKKVKATSPEAGAKAGMTLKKAAPTIAIAAAIAAASYQVYKRYLSKAAQACKGKGGSERSLCMQQYKDRAYKMRLSNMQSGMKNCNKTTNPEKCKGKVRSTMDQIKNKIRR